MSTEFKAGLSRRSFMRTLGAASIAATSLPAFAAVKLIVPAFYSTQDTRTPVRTAFVAMGVNILLNLIFLFYFIF